MTRHEELQSIYWDFYKEVHNIRPRWIDFSALSEAELEKMLDDLDVASKAVFAARDEEEALAVKSFESRVTELMTSGAGDRATAIRWLADSVNAGGDDQYLAWNFGLPYGYIKDGI